MALLQRSEAVPEGSEVLRMRLADARQSDGQPLAAAASAGEFGYEVGGWGTGGSLIVGEVANGNTKTDDLRLEIPIPQNLYTGTGEIVGDARSLKLRMRAHVDVVVNTAATLDIEAYKLDDEGARTGSDLYAGSAQDVNTTSWADIDFTISLGTLSPGDMLEVVVRGIANDSSGANSGRIEIGDIQLLATTVM